MWRRNPVRRAGGILLRLPPGECASPDCGRKRCVPRSKWIASPSGFRRVELLEEIGRGPKSSLNSAADPRREETA
jgi:hypothetical protein